MKNIDTIESLKKRIKALEKENLMLHRKKRCFLHK
jgi:hypothetical protein